MSKHKDTYGAALFASLYTSLESEYSYESKLTGYSSFTEKIIPDGSTPTINRRAARRQRKKK
jgi:hypothetical protein